MYKFKNNRQDLLIEIQDERHPREKQKKMRKKTGLRKLKNKSKKPINPYIYNFNVENFLRKKRRIFNIK